LRHSAVDDAQGIAFGVTMAALGMHILTHMGFVTGQTTGIAVLLAHLTGLPFPAVYFAVTLPFLGLAWVRLGARFALKTLATTAALSATCRPLAALDRAWGHPARRRRPSVRPSVRHRGAGRHPPRRQFRRPFRPVDRGAGPHRLSRPATPNCCPMR
jgi:hypothetical protein